jgi:hypothetical protein
MNGVDLTRKFAAYATYLTSGRWREVTPDRVLPVLLIVVQGRGQMDRMRRVATNVFSFFPALPASASPLRLATDGRAAGTMGAARTPFPPFLAFITLAHRLEKAGPLAAIWWPLLSPSSPYRLPSLVLAAVTLQSSEKQQPPPDAQREQVRCVFPRLSNALLRNP